MAGDILGGSSSSTQSQSESKPIDVTPSEFQQLRGPIADALKGLIGAPLQQGGGAAPVGVAGLTGQEQSFLDLIGQTVGQGPNALQRQGRDLLGRTISGDFLGAEGNPFLDAAIQSAQRSVIQGFEDVALPRLQGQFTAAGQRVAPEGSSAFDRAAALATRGLTQELGDIATDISFGNFQAERGRQQEAAVQAEQITQQDLNNAVQGLQAVALPRLIEQFGIDQGVEEFNRRLNTVLQSLAIAQGLPLAVVGQHTVSTSTGESSSSPGIADLLKGSAAAFSAGFPGGF